MRVAFCVLVVVALVALPAPTLGGVVGEALDTASNGIRTTLKNSPLANRKKSIKVKVEDTEELKKPRLSPKKAREVENFRSASQTQIIFENLFLKYGFRLLRPFKQLHEIHWKQIEAAEKVPVEFRLERSPPLSEAKSEINLGRLRLKKAEFTDIMREETGLELMRLYYQAQLHIQSVKGRVLGLQKHKEELELSDRYEISTNREDWLDTINSIITDHEEDIKSVENSLESFWSDLLSKYGHGASRLYEKYTAGVQAKYSQA